MFQHNVYNENLDVNQEWIGFWIRFTSWSTIDKKAFHRLYDESAISENVNIGL